MAFTLVAMASNLEAMACNLLAMASTLVVVASTTASNLEGMASNLLALGISSPFEPTWSLLGEPTESCRKHLDRHRRCSRSPKRSKETERKTHLNKGHERPKGMKKKQEATRNKCMETNGARGRYERSSWHYY